MAFAVHAGGMSLPPFPKRLPKRLSRYDMFPLKARGALDVTFGLVPTTGQVDGGPVVRTPTVELLLVVGIDLWRQLLGLLGR
jgi:hypothetical protein